MSIYQAWFLNNIVYVSMNLIFTHMYVIKFTWPTYIKQYTYKYENLEEFIANIAKWFIISVNYLNLFFRTTLVKYLNTFLTI